LSFTSATSGRERQRETRREREREKETRRERERERDRERHAEIERDVQFLCEFSFCGAGLSSFYSLLFVLLFVLQLCCWVWQPLGQLHGADPPRCQPHPLDDHHWFASLTHTDTHSPTHSHPPIHSLIHSLIHSFTLSHSLTHSLTHSFTHSLTHSLTPLHSLLPSLIHGCRQSRDGHTGHVHGRR
jgi:hypothetical protein